ncbi:DegT/DnrJ/EryC1/StrS family aminotransferase [Solirubrobacter sp. CPCC 204708]|uniref:DegT/DnrJ/EryC1/StrS family aminotransferase n=1 Tax=Solirubrobacter deserti TaxID=2282478 RepID=A0ABT4RMG5_9ACTN|nr:DegT/DnrJ/EryC1/StrS family aminotransferase [Solirubrobacter deserti]MBE2316895.1 DegT/DnrJ/EryC1/StrS family aminotransferase [Solirubrobacter deserti]MDA0139726.1 DegT/DnrJ/EryC1/StrS family aminotransferase [Solirubrobacter deserti]
MSVGVRVPFLELLPGTQELRRELDAAVERVLDSGWYLLGAELDAFEAAWAEHCGAQHCVAVGSGLDALRFILEARGIGPGDEVLVPGQTFIATWLAVSAIGATPVPVEVDEAHHTLDHEAAAAAITERTAAILPVDLYGHPADHRALRELADANGLLLVDDAAQAHGTRLHGKPVGTYADAAAWSFYPGKNLGALGDGGAVTTDDADLAARVRRLRNYGSARRYEHVEVGYNSRLDELQCAVLRVKLGHLDAWNARRVAVAERYLADLGGHVTLPVVRAGADPCWHLFTVRHERRDALRDHLEAAGVQTLIHYPIPPHRQGAYAGTALADAHLPVSDAIAGTIVSLPIGPHLSDADVDRVIEAVASF